MGANLNHILVIGAVISAVVLGLIGLLVYASPSPTDRLGGGLMIATAAAIIVMTAFHQKPYVAIILKVFVAVVALGTIWLLLRMFRNG